MSTIVNAELQAYMSRIYANLCEKGLRNFNTVPTELQAEVRALIEADGYIINADGTVTKAIY